MTAAYSQDATHLSAALSNTGVRAGAGGRSSVRRCCPGHWISTNSRVLPDAAQHGMAVGLSKSPVCRAGQRGLSPPFSAAQASWGGYVANSMARQGSQVVYPHRCDELNVQHLKVMGDLGQVGTMMHRHVPTDRRSLLASHPFWLRLGLLQTVPRIGSALNRAAHTNQRQGRQVVPALSPCSRFRTDGGTVRLRRAGR